MIIDDGGGEEFDYLETRKGYIKVPKSKPTMTPNNKGECCEKCRAYQYHATGVTEQCPCPCHASVPQERKACGCDGPISCFDHMVISPSKAESEGEKRDYSHICYCNKFKKNGCCVHRPNLKPAESEGEKQFNAKIEYRYPKVAFSPTDVLARLKKEFELGGNVLDFEGDLRKGAMRYLEALFVREIDRAREEGRQHPLGTYQIAYEAGRAAEQSRILQIIEGMKRKGAGQVQHYNAALFDLAAAIKNDNKNV